MQQEMPNTKPAVVHAADYNAVPRDDANKSPGLDKRCLDMTYDSIEFKVGDKAILSNCSGVVKCGEVCAIMGPSGAGKSSLLNVLAGRSQSVDNISVRGNVYVSGTKVNPVEYRKKIAYVMQDDALMATQTPEETLRFSASLRLPESTSPEEIEKLVNSTISKLGLDSCKDVVVGSEMIKGISGGQRKRTSIGVEIITNPELLFCKCN